MKRFKTLYLHIGLGKTGTTSVQRDILARAGELEARYDLHYPTDFPHERHFHGNHSMLLRALFSSQDNVRERLAAKGLVSDKSIQAYNKQTLERLEKGFAASKASQLLLSAEGVGHFSRQDMLALARWLQAYAEDIQVLACLRHPADALSSEIQQRLNIGDTLDMLYEKPPIYPFKSLFTRVEQSFGEGALLVYDFAEAVRHPRGVTGALFERIGSDAMELFDSKPAVNTSMSHEAALLINALNLRRPVLVDGKPNPLRADNAAQKIMKIPGRKYTAPREVYQKVEARVERDMKWLRNRHGVELRAQYPESPLEHNSFSAESIEALALALQMADLHRLRFKILSPLRSVFLWSRSFWRRWV